MKIRACTTLIKAASMALGACAITLCLANALPTQALAVTEGWQEAGTCEWTQDGTKLVVQPLDAADTGVLPEWTSAASAPWAGSATEFKSVEVKAGVSATSCEYLFAGLSNARSFDLSGLDTSSVTDFSYMFRGCAAMERAQLEKIDFSYAQTLRGIFYDCTHLISADLSCVKAPQLTDLSYIFDGCVDLQDLTLEGIETGALTTLEAAFWGCNKLQTVDIQALDTSKVTTFSHLFASCSSLKNIDAAAIDTTSATTFESMFQHCKSIKFLNVAGWNTKNVTSLECAFSECDGLESFDFAKWDLSNVKTAKMMFEADNSLKSIDLTPFRKATDLRNVYAMFNQCVNLKSVNVRCIDFSHLDVDGLAHFLDGCASIKSIDMSGVSFGNCADPEQVFSGCKSLTKVNLAGAQFKYGVTFAEMFMSCEKLKTVDFSNVYAPLLTEMNMMFAYCTSLKTVDFTGATFGAINSASNAFKNCTSLTTLDLSGITSSKKSFTQMFYGCYADSYKPMQGYTADGPKAHPSISSVTVSKIANVKYNGAYRTPAVTLSVKDSATYVWGDLLGKTLTQGKHYTVTYSNNKKVGKATVTIKGIGIFKGTVKKTFKILPK